MSETLGFETILAEETEARPPDPENRVADYIDPEIDDSELYNLVSQNAHVIVKFGSSEMTLSEAMWQIPITKDNIPSVISMVRELLANRVTETEEPAEEEKTEEEEPAETEKERPDETKKATQKTIDETKIQKPQENKADTNRQAEKGIDVAKAPVSRVETYQEAMDEDSPSSDVRSQTKLAKSDIEQPAKVTPKVPAAVSTTPESPAQKLTIVENVQEIAAVASSAADRPSEVRTVVEPATNTTATRAKYVGGSEAYAAVDSAAAETNVELDTPKSVNYQETESYVLPESVEAPTGLEVPELPILELESLAALDEEFTEMADDRVEIVEDELTFVGHDYQIDGQAAADFIEGEEFLLAHSEEDNLEADSLYEQKALEAVVEGGPHLAETTPVFEAGSEPDPAERAEIIGPEQIIQISLPVEEIEEALIQLAGRIEASEPETIEMVNEILDKILEVPVKFKTDDGEKIIAEAEAQEQLQELFTELFERAGIEYTPELIESLARLTLRWDLADEIERLKNEEETDGVPHDCGTHEIIKKLLLSLNNVKKSMLHAYAIGRSALQLYTFDVAA